MLEQYIELRDRYAEHLLLFQVGDFFETFGEDAERAAKLLGITLTHKTSKDFSTPMSGIPIRAADQHIEKLLSLGVRVAVAEQFGDVNGPGLVERRVTQVLSPGTVAEERLLRPEENYLAAVATGDGYALALLDVSTGEFRCCLLSSRGALYEELARENPAEVLVAPEILENAAVSSEFKNRFPLMYSSASFGLEAGREELIKQFGTVPESLSAPALIRACGAALRYAGVALQGKLEMVTRLSRYEPGSHMQLSESAMTALELFRPLSPGGQTLLDLLCQTRTAGGRRRLRAWLRQPLLEKGAIGSRQDAVATLLAQPDLREGVRSALYRAHDLERLSARVASGRALPREVASLARTLELLPDISQILAHTEGMLSSVRTRLTPLPEVLSLIRAALVDDPPIKLLEGGLIKEGFHAELDALRAEALEGRAWMAQLETLERERTGISSLKVAYNNVLGYFLEVTFSKGVGQIPPDYRQIATLKDRARYTRPDLREKERQIAKAESAAAALEAAVFNELRESLARFTDHFHTIAGAISELDVLACFAEIAAAKGWVRPVTLEGSRATAMGDRGRYLALEQGRHPVVEDSIGEKFVPNDAHLSEQRFVGIITGPNMAGKSTYLRTVALCALLHQMGGFVPALSAELPLFDAIHTRIGASDDLAGGRSTFMVEMSELAHILHQATPSSLIILDEVGRGTSTLDGLAIAWAALEHLQELGAFTLFATHYFELTRLAGRLPGVVNLHVAALEEQDSLTFYHQVREGAASQSYGVSVARMAGLPSSVTSRAATLLSSLQTSGKDTGRDLVREIAALELGRLSPMQALEVLYKLQERIGRGE